MWNWVPLLIAFSLVMPFRAFEPDSASGDVRGNSLTAAVCPADCNPSCEPEGEDSELFVDSRHLVHPPAHFLGCVVVLQFLFVARADIDPLTCRPPPVACCDKLA